MGRTNYKHALIVTAVLMALALYGMVVVEFVFICAVCILVAAMAFCAFLIFAKAIDSVINFFYTAK